MPPQRVSLDLTSVTPRFADMSSPATVSHLSTIISKDTYNMDAYTPSSTNSVLGDDDVLAGCKAYPIALNDTDVDAAKARL